MKFTRVLLFIALIVLSKEIFCQEDTVNINDEDGIVIGSSNKNIGKRQSYQAYQSNNLKNFPTPNPSYPWPYEMGKREVEYRPTQNVTWLHYLGKRKLELPYNFTLNPNLG